jgi:hypothetical protein
VAKSLFMGSKPKKWRKPKRDRNPNSSSTSPLLVVFTRYCFEETLQAVSSCPPVSHLILFLFQLAAATEEERKGWVKAIQLQGQLFSSKIDGITET